MERCNGVGNGGEWCRGMGENCVVNGVMVCESEGIRLGMGGMVL